jgi:hypothetical protein
MDWEVKMSQHHAVSRQTLYSWKGKGEQALQGAILFN